jgi:hypothetical protein
MFLQILLNEFEDKVQFDGRIYLLKTLASFINPSENSEIPVTLNARRTVVSGIMIGMKPYYEYFGKSMLTFSDFQTFIYLCDHTLNMHRFQTLTIPHI